MSYDPDLVTKVMAQPIYSVLARTGLDAAAARTWDGDLLRESRVLVPVDVQALVVGPDGEDAVLLPGPLTPGAAADATSVDGPSPLAPPQRREGGVHLQWALPDALLRGRLQDPRSAPAPGAATPGGGLDLPALPDRWAVLRLLVPAKGGPAHVRGWLLDAASGQVRDLAAGPSSEPLPLPGARVVPPAELTGVVGGSLTWTGSYDSSLARFAWRDDLQDLLASPDLDGTLPGGAAAGSATYLVVGWWSHPDLDPLDGVRTGGRLAERTGALGWRIVAGAGAEDAERLGRLGRLAALGVPLATRFPALGSTVAALRAPSPGVAEPREAPERLARDDDPIRAMFGRAAAQADLGAAGADRDRARDRAGAVQARAVGVQSLAGPVTSAFSASTVPAFQSLGAVAFARDTARWVSGRGVGVEASTLLHGAVVSVPLPVPSGAADPAVAVPAPDLRPAAADVRPVLAEHVDDLVAASLGARLGLDSDARAGVERLLSAFSADLLPRLSDAEGLVEIDERAHAAGFAAVDPGEPPLVDRVLTGRASVPPRAPHPQASAGGSKLVFLTEAVAVTNAVRYESSAETVARAASFTPASRVSATSSGRFAVAAAASGAAPGPTRGPAAAARPAAPRGTQPGEQLVDRPAPRRYVPLDPLVGVLGAGRGLRHGGDGRGDADEKLACRRGSQVVTGYSGLVHGSDLLTTLGSGALPEETLALAREALLLSPHLLRSLSRRAVELSGRALDRESVTTRLVSELALRYDGTGAYLGKSSPALTLARGDADPVEARTRELLRRHSMLEGVEPDLVAITSWAQPWIPLWVEWSLEVVPADDLTGWTLGAVDLDPTDPLGAPPQRAPLAVSGRTPLTTAPGTALAGAVASWLVKETARDVDRRGEADPDTQAQLATLGAHAASLDMLGASMDGVRTALLGLPGTRLRVRDADGNAVPPTPVALPELLATGAVRLTGLRVVDAFGRFLDVDASAPVVPAHAAVVGAPDVLARAPRFSAPARCLTRFVAASATDAASAVDAVVDEVESAKQISPVVGFLLPDHVDESVEVFGSDGTPLGELSVDARGGGVMWACAPGRPLPADAAPGDGLTPDQAVLGLFASGMVAADAQARQGRTADAEGAPAESALSAFLRAVDTTLWTVDPVAGAGSSGLASIVGRPVAVVRLTVELDVGDDLDDLTVTAAERDARALAYAGLARVGVRVRIGELTRSDDGVLAWFVDDDHRTCHVVDKVVRDAALEAGRGRGHLGAWGTTPQVPAPDPIDHPYLVAEDELVLHPGVPRLLTVLMLPGSSLTVTAGVVPRQSLRLSRGWFVSGLERLSPSVRVGPLLVDPGEVRLPPVAALGEKQVLTSREGPLTWRDDAILAATQAALLPDRATVLREGWIRVDPAAGAATVAEGGA